MSTAAEKDRFACEIEDHNARLPLLAAATEVAGGTAVAVVEDTSFAHEVPVVHDAAQGVGVALCIGGLGLVLHHARMHWHAVKLHRKAEEQRLLEPSQGSFRNSNR